MEQFRKEILKVLQKEFPHEKVELLMPPDRSLGDAAFACFSVAKTLKKNPNQIAEELKAKLKLPSIVKKVETQGAYLNFFVNKQSLAEDVIRAIKKGKFGSGAKKKEKIVVEYPAPNTNKPLHLGHVRNILLGNSLCNLLRFAGYEVIPVDLVNDRGVHVCKSMLAYKRWGRGKEPDKKPDHFVGDFYVMYSKKESPEMEQEIREMLKQWEEGDKELRALWKKMRTWALHGFKETYEAFDVHHDKTYYESDTYMHGKELILEGLKKGLFQKDEKGAIVVDLEGLGKKVLLREDGTGIYITQDIYLAKLKFDDFRPDRSVYVVANEQIHHFKVLFKVLDILGFSFSKKCYHLAYGMVFLPEGKMKSREGIVVDADDLVDEMKKIASDEVRKRYKLKDDEVEKRSRIIGMGALKFFVLKFDPQKDFVYNPEESISFEGETGPYVQYAHARICSVLRKHKKKPSNRIKFSLLTSSHEEKIIVMLSQFPDVAEDAAEHYRPYVVARYLIELAQAFNEFYHECPILQSEKELMEARLSLIVATKKVLADGLGLLGIDAPEEM
jgi:arginyl-tRNA synthetase